MVSLKCLQEIDNLDRLIIRSEIESVIKKKKKLPTNKSLGPDGFTGKFYQTFKDNLYQFFSDSSKKLKRKRIHSNQF